MMTERAGLRREYVTGLTNGWPNGAFETQGKDASAAHL